MSQPCMLLLVREGLGFGVENYAQNLANNCYYFNIKLKYGDETNSHVNHYQIKV